MNLPAYTLVMADGLVYLIPLILDHGWSFAFRTSIWSLDEMTQQTGSCPGGAVCVWRWMTKMFYFRYGNTILISPKDMLTIDMWNHGAVYIWRRFLFTPQPFGVPRYCRRPSGRAAGKTGPPGGGHSVRFHTGVCSSGVRTLTGPILGKAGLRKHTLF